MAVPRKSTSRLPFQIRTAGFTLLELLIAMVMVSVLLALSGPTFVDTLQRNRQSTALNDVVGVLAYARGEAVARSAIISACSTADPYATTITCRNTNVYDDGWLIFVDDGSGGGVAGNGQIDGSEVLLRTRDDAPRDVTVRTYNFPRVSAISFDDTGLSTGRGTIVICDARGADEASALVVNLSGQSRLAQDDPADTDSIVEDDAGNAVVCP